MLQWLCGSLCSVQVYKVVLILSSDKRNLFDFSIGFPDSSILLTLKVLAMINDDECLTDVAVEVAWAGRTCGVPLSHLQGIDVDAHTTEAIADWHYWLATGNRR